MNQDQRAMLIEALIENFAWVNHEDYLQAHRVFNAAYQAALESPEVQGLRKDAERLDWLDKMNETLNRHYGTTYRWELILSPNVVRLMAGRGGNGYVGDIDLKDSSPHGVPSCRLAIDAAMEKQK